MIGFPRNHIHDEGPHIARRLYSFSRGRYGLMENDEEERMSRLKGRVKISGLIFDIKSIKKDLEVRISVQNPNDWYSLKKQFEKAFLEKGDYWVQSEFLKEIKRKMNKRKESIQNLEFKIIDEENYSQQCLVKGIFNSTNKDKNYYFVLDYLIGPLSLYHSGK